MKRILLLLSLVVVIWISWSRAGDQRTFCAKTAAGWIEVFRDKARTEKERRFAAWALDCLGPEAKAAAPDFIEALRHGQFVFKPIDVLVDMGADPNVILVLLAKQFGNTDGRPRSLFDPNVQGQLAKIGAPAVPFLVDILNGKDAGMSAGAAEILGKMGVDGRAAIPALIQAVEHPANDTNGAVLRYYAVRALGRIGPEAKAAAPALVGLLDKAGDDEFDVVMALDRIGFPPSRKLVATFLRDGDGFAAWELARLGPKAQEVAPILSDALTDKRLRVRVSAAVAVAYIEPTCLEAIPVLIEALNREDEEIDVSRVQNALAQFGPKAKGALPTLIGDVKHGSFDDQILKALVQIDPEAAQCVPALTLALSSNHCKVVDVAADSLGLLGPRAKHAVAALTAAVTRDFKDDLLNGCDPQVSAAHALRRIGPDAKSAIPALVAALEYRLIVRSEFGGPFDDSKERLSVATAAARVLGSFEADAESAIPALIEAVQTDETEDANQFVREAAALALGQIGARANAAVPILRNLARENAFNDRSLPAVTVALYQLAPDGKEIAEEWLALHTGAPTKGGMIWSELESRAMVLGAMGRTSFETDCLTRSYLQQLDSMTSYTDPRAGDPFEPLEWWFEKVARLGRAGRLAIPRLKELCHHANPRVRMWAKETLDRVEPGSTKRKKGT